MRSDLPSPVARVAHALREAAVEARLEEFAQGTPTAEDAASAAGCKLAQIVKSLVFACEGRWILALVPGDARADRTKVAAAAACPRVRIAGPDEVRIATGFEPGGVAPFPLPGIRTVLIDRALLAHDVVWVGAGSPKHMAAIAPPDLVRLARARAVDLVASETTEEMGETR